MKLLTITMLVLLGNLLLTTGAQSQIHRKPGLRDNTPQVHAFNHARIVVSPNRVLEQATLIIRDGFIEAVGEGIPIPPDAWVIDLKGKTIYPGFLEMYTHSGLPTPKQLSEQEKTSGNGARHWNPQVRSPFSSTGNYAYSEKDATALRSQGFVAAHVVSEAGVFKGHGSLVKLADDTPERQIILPDFTQGLSFNASRELGRGYPTSVMGSIALIRQSLYDAQYYSQAHEHLQNKPGSMPTPGFSPGIEALSDALKQDIPFVIVSEDEQQIFRAASLASEFNLNMWVAASGHEYRRAEEIKNTGLHLMVPLAFPEQPDISKPETSINLSLEELRHWHMAPFNPLMLQEAGVSFSFTSHGLKKKEELLKNLRKAIQYGLSQQTALAALTTIPAEKMKVSHLYGTLEKGKSACFFIASGDIFDDSSHIHQVWVQGKKHTVKEENPLAGQWNTDPDFFKEYALIIQAKEKGLNAELFHSSDSITKKLSDVKWENNRLSFKIEKDSIWEGMRLSASLGQEELLGFGEKDDGSFFTWQAGRENMTLPPSEEKKKEEKEKPSPLSSLYPAMEYGVKGKPDQPGHIFIRNATLWTQGPDGVLENADMIVREGKILSVGKNLTPPSGAVIIDASGRHVTPGLIDPHLHTSIDGGVNEVGDAITSETRITDVIDANNVWIYRLLAGGLTTANLFHGSANPIGGQSAVIKMRHGEQAHGLLMEGAKPGLKFALGENVKRMEERYPNTRMGTEQIIRDAFEAALQYEKDKETARGTDRRGRDARPFRKDIQLEPILEVLKGERLAHVHAYRQDEMIMMMRLAEEFGFTVASFEHTVEGYKIADELREHGAAAIVWTDWSSFKVEAYDAIHQNAKLLLDAGVLTSLHSDNTQLATRMHWEAGKVLRSGVEEIEALNLITLYPAKIMKIDHLTGTLEPGKHADFVIWNGHPLSAFTIADETWVDGRKYFDRQKDRELQEEIIKERVTLIKKAAGSK